MGPDPFYSREELLALGFSAVGQPTWVSRKASLYAIKGSLGDHVRVDDFCVLKGRLNVGSYVHICSFVSISGVGGTVELMDGCSIANRVSIYTASDDFKADSLNSNLVPQDMVTTIRGDVRVGRGAMVGAHSVVMPGSQIGDAAAISALSVVSQSVEPGVILVNGSVRSLPAGKRNVEKILGMLAALLQCQATEASPEKP